jgi:plasmid maintenance system killer protein
MIVSFRDAWLRDFFIEDARAKRISFSTIVRVAPRGTSAPPLSLHHGAV